MVFKRCKYYQFRINHDNCHSFLLPIVLFLLRLIKNIRNITSIFIAFLLLSGGNFAFAIAHGDCIMVENGYITCEMDCCKENPCLEENNDGKVIIKDNSKSCCEVHVEKSMEQDVTLPVVLKKSEISKLFSFTLHSTSLVNETSGAIPVIHKFKTSNIPLINSNLRI